MASQSYFLDLEVLNGVRHCDNGIKKRERPQRWKNFYSVYAYNFTAYHDFCKDLLRGVTICPLLISPAGEKLLLCLLVYRLILEHARQVGEPEYRKWFFVLDKAGNTQPDSDEKHIFRTATLQKLYEKIYDFCNVNPFVKFENIKRDGLTIWYEDRQAEITGAELLSIKDRLKLHIKLLRLLKKGYDIKSAVKKVKNNI